MTVETLRPDATVYNVGGTLNGSSVHAAWSDESDGTYVQFKPTQHAKVTLEDMTLPTGAIVDRFSTHLRGSAPGTYASRIGCSLHSSGMGVLTTEVSYASSTIASSTFHQTPPSPISDESTIDGLSVTLQVPYAAPDDIRVVRLAVDVRYLIQPVVTVDTISTPVTDSTNVTASWSTVFDDDSAGPTRYEVKVFDSATYGGGGFDAATSIPAYTSGEVIGIAEDAVVGPLVDGETYKVFVRVAQAATGTQTHWSEWASNDAFTINVDTADVDAITATPNDAGGYIAVELDWDSASEPWEYLEVQRSIDDKATWTDVRFATYVEAYYARTIGGVPVADPDGNLAPIDGSAAITFRDYEVPNDADVWYRARATWIDGTSQITGDWLETSSAVEWASEDNWLIVPNTPSLNVVVTPYEQSLAPLAFPVRAGVFDIIPEQGATYTERVVVSAGVSSPGWAIGFLTQTDNELAAVVAACEAGQVMLNFRPGSKIGRGFTGRMYATVTGQQIRWADPSLMLSDARVVYVNLVETAAPADPNRGN